MKPDEIQSLADQLKKIANQARKTASALLRYQNKPINRIKTLEKQSHELKRTSKSAFTGLSRHIEDLRSQQSAHTQDHSGAFSTGSSDEPGRDSE